MYKDIVRKSMVRVRVRKDISVAEVWDVEGGVDGTRRGQAQWMMPWPHFRRLAQQISFLSCDTNDPHPGANGSKERKEQGLAAGEQGQNLVGGPCCIRPSERS